MTKKIVLVDLFNILYKAYYALPKLSNSRGEPTGALYGVIRMYFKIVESFKPDCLIFTGESKTPTLKKKEFDFYKAGRPPMPDDLKFQLPLVLEFLEITNTPFLKKEGYEADDLIAAFVKKFKDNKIQIISGDKDLLQLLDEPNVEQLKLKKGVTEFETLNKNNLKDYLGVHPSQVADYLSLVGDASDNLPGVKGIGPKGAAALLSEYGDLKNIYDNLNNIKSAKAAGKLKAEKENAFLTRRLVSFASLKIDLSLNDCAVSRIKLEKAAPFVKKYGMFSLLDKLGLKEENEEIKFVYGKINFNKLKEAFVYFNGEARVFFLSERTVFEASKKDMENILKLNITLTGYDLKEFIKYCLKNFSAVNCYFNDALFYPYLKNPDTPDFSLLKTAPGSYGEIAPVEDYFIRLLKVIEYYPLDEQAEKIINDIENPFLRILSQMENSGVKIDNFKLQNLKNNFQALVKKTADEIKEIAGTDFNINSPKQLSKVLFEDLNLAPDKKTKTGYSTDISVLETLSGGHPIIEKIINYRFYFKLLTTYIEPLLEKQENSFIHTTFNPVGAATGRISSLNPNLQNLPSGYKESDFVKECFIVRDKKNIFISLDYSQIELRILAHFSKDDYLIECFRENRDIHDMVARRIFHKDDITPAERRAAKTINFGVLYGMSVYRLARQLKISFFEAKEYIESFYENFSGVRKYTEKAAEEAEKKNYVQTATGRKRFVNLKQKNYNLREAEKRIAVNSPIQGTAADIIKIAAVRMEETVKKHGALFLLQIHDEIIIEAPLKVKEKLGKELKEIMDNCFSLSVPLKADVKYGINLGALK